MFTRSIASIISKTARPRVAAPARGFASDAHHADHSAVLFKPMGSSSFWVATGILAASFIYMTTAKGAESDVFPVYKAVLDEEVKIGKRNSDYTINPTYAAKAPSAEH